MSLIQELLATPSNVPNTSKHTAMNGLLYLVARALLVAWPGATQVLFRDRDFVGDEQGLIRAMGMAVAVIGWL